MVLVDEQEDTIERVVMVPGERFIDRETIGVRPRAARDIAGEPGPSLSCGQAPGGPTGRWAGPGT